MVVSEGLFDVKKLERWKSDRDDPHFVFNLTQVAGKAATSMPKAARQAKPPWRSR
jgi:hypothetical protein